MRRLLPRSLFGQTLLILLAGLIVSHLFGAWLYNSDREETVRAIGGLALAQRIANLARLVEDAPEDWRDRIVAASSDPGFRVTLVARRPALPASEEKSAISQIVRDFIVAQLPDSAGDTLHVAASELAGPSFAMPFARPPRREMAMLHTARAWRGLRVALRLADGQWLAFATELPDSGPAVSQQIVLSMGVMAVIILAVSAWAVRRVTAPLGELAAAAERLGRDVGASPLREIGTIEMRRASRAFNEMQIRLKRLVENRMRMLAAISHDLRTPLTLLRLRSENVPNEEEREKLLATIAEMSAMIDATLAFARDESAAEPRRRVDLAALLSSIVDDLEEAGMAVTMDPAPAIVCDCQPAALKRAITNLIDNAIKYGSAAHAAIRRERGQVEITIDDKGPGLPEAELARVFQPFYRIEKSRSRDTGGIGLGLAIALAIAQAHGGELKLTNQAEGGLRAALSLPC
jgi:signal transduction histidine kinase